MSKPGSRYRAAFDDGVSWHVNGNSWRCSGWAFSADGDQFDLVLEIGSERHVVSREIARPDVAAAYRKTKSAGHCGFAQTFQIQTGTHLVRLLAVTGSSRQCILETTLDVAGVQLRFNVDTPSTRTIDAGPCRISGWCFHPDEVIDSLVVGAAGEQVAARYGLDRPDVAAATDGAPDSCGFEAYLTLPPGRTRIKLDARLRSGALVSATTPGSLRVCSPSLRTRATLTAASLIGLVRRGVQWRRSRGRWPKLREWPHLLRRATQEISRALGEAAVGGAAIAPSPVDRYDAWLAVNAWTASSERRLRDRLTVAAGRLPTLSVVMPVFDPKLEFLAAAVDSVRSQVYARWELCIADDHSTDSTISAYLRTLAAEDNRVRVRFRTVNANISVATNDAASLATGDILLFLDHDDVLAPDCLAEIALAAIEHPDADIFYSDDDKIAIDGHRHSPQFKPEFSPELLLSYMYMSHAFAVRRKLFHAMGGMRIGYEGSQDYDFALRASEFASEVVHIPRILYHWRVVAGSTAQSGDAKPASFDAGSRAVSEALARRRLNASVAQPAWAKQARIGVFGHDFPDAGPQVTIIIPTRNQLALVKQCLASLARTTYRDYRVLIVDNESDDRKTLDFLQHCGHEVLRVPSPMGKFNFAHLNNVAARHAGTEFLLFLNNDTEVIEPRWLSRMVGYAMIRGVGAVGARLLYADGTLQHAGIVHGYYDGFAGPAFKNLRREDAGYLCYAKVARNYSAATAACLLTPRTTFLTLGGFDEQRFGVAYNDVDYGYRLTRSGMRCVYAAGAELFHHEGRSRGFADEPRELAEFRRTYRAMNDPCYSRHLSLEDEHFAIQPVRIETGPAPRRIRALMCAFNLNWEGAPYSQFEMTRELARRGVLEPIVFSPTDGPLRAAYEGAGIPVHVRGHPLAGCTTADEYAAAIGDLSAWIDSLRVSVVYGNTLQTFYAIDAAHRIGVPSLWNPRESEPWREYFRGFGPDIERSALRCFQYPYRIVFVARATAGVYQELNSHHNFCVIHNGLDPAVIARDKAMHDRVEVRRRLDIADREIAILLLGTVCERKGQLDAIDAWAKLPNATAARARLFIVGDRAGPYSSRIHARLAQIPATRRERIRIVQETPDVAAYFSAADGFLCTSRIESYPRVILEAMAWELPIVTTPVFGIAEQVRPEVNALLYEPGDTTRLAQQLARVIDNDDLRLRLARSAPDVLATLNDFAQMTDQYARLFEEASLLAEALPCAALPA